MPTIGTTKAAEMLGLTPERVTQLCRSGDLKATQIGRTWALDSRSVEAFARKDRPGPGRPPSDSKS